MSTTRRRLPSGVYWRRRLFVLGTVAALVLLGINLVRDGGGEPTASDDVARLAGEPDATETPAPAAPTKRAKPRRPKGGVTTQPTPEPTPEPAPEPADPSGTCQPSDVVVVPSPTTSVAGGPVTITLSVGTVESPACYWTLTRGSLALKITSGGEEVWSSSVCPRQLPTVELVARRDLPARYDLVWDGRASLPECRGNAPAADAGDYAVVTAALGGEPSDPVPFTLLDPEVVPEEPDTEEPEPDVGLRNHAEPLRWPRG